MCDRTRAFKQSRKNKSTYVLLCLQLQTVENMYMYYIIYIYSIYILYIAYNICRNNTLFTSTLDLELRKKLVKCYVWSIALYGVETWTLRAVDQKHLGSFAGGGWKRSAVLTM